MEEPRPLESEYKLERRAVRLWVRFLEEARRKLEVLMMKFERCEKTPIEAFESTEGERKWKPHVVQAYLKQI